MWRATLRSAVTFGHAPCRRLPQSRGVARDADAAAWAWAQTLSLREVRETLDARGVSRVGIIEAPELRRALAGDEAIRRAFSPTGCVLPGKVADLRDEELEAELAPKQGVPVVLACYASWCGPCQNLIPELANAALMLGRSARVVQVDADRHRGTSNRFDVRAFPTLVFILPGGDVVHRREGGTSANEIVRLARAHLGLQG